MSAVSIQKSGTPLYPLVVVWHEGDRERRKYCKCQRDAAAFRNKKAAELAHITPQQQQATPEEHRAVVHARVHNVPLFEAVEHWKATVGKTKGITVADLCELRLGEAGGEKHSDRHKHSLELVLPKIAASDLGKLPASGVTAEQVALWLRTKGAPSSQRWYRAILSGVFQSAMRAGLATWNPASLVKLAKTAAKAPEILTVDQAAHWMACVMLEAPALAPGYSIGLFAGLRGAELERLDWSEVRLDRGFIEVTAGKSKTKTRRLVDIMLNLAVWLEPYRLAKGPVMPEVVRPLKERALAAYGQPVPRNAIRHSFVSYHLALFADVAKTELQAGHDRAVLFGHYRELVTQDEAEEFFTIAP